MQNSIPLAHVFLATLALSIASAGSSRCDAETIVDEARGYTLRLPEGFVEVPDDVDFGPTIDRAFYRGDLNDDQADILLLVDPMNGTIGREPVSLDHLPPGFQGRLARTKWKSFDVDMFVVPETANGVDFLTYNVQIPFARQAVQFKLFGPADREAELESTLDEVLAGLDGESSWSRPESAGRRLRMLSSPWISEDGFPTIFIACLIAFGVVGLVVFYLLSRFGPPGSVLIAGFCLFAASWAFPENDYRELRGLEGGMGMLGDAAILLGIADLVFKRWRKPRAAPSSVEPEPESNDAVS